VSSAHTEQTKEQKGQRLGQKAGQKKKGRGPWPETKTRKESESCANWANEINKFR